MVSLVLAEIYILAYGGSLLSFVRYLEIIGVVMLSVLSGSAMMFFLVSFFNSNNAFATGSAILGTLIGFIGGIYMPIGNFPSVIQSIIKVFPISHSVSLLRQIMMNDILTGILPAAALDNYQEFMGIFLKVGDTNIAPWMSILYLLASAILFFALSVIKLKRKSRQY